MKIITLSLVKIVERMLEHLVYTGSVSVSVCYLCNFYVLEYLTLVLNLLSCSQWKWRFCYINSYL